MHDTLNLIKYGLKDDDNYLSTKSLPAEEKPTSKKSDTLLTIENENEIIS